MGHIVTQHMLTLRAYPEQWASDFSEELCIEAAQDLIAPVAPSSFALNSVAEGIELTWVNPTLNFDGTTCNDLAWIAVYRSTSSGIDPNNPGTYDKKTLLQGEAYIFRSDQPAQTYYFLLTALDRTGNESEVTSELSDSPDAIDVSPVIPDDASGLVFNDAIGGDGVVGGHALIGIAFKSPVSTWVGFDRYRLWWQYTTDGGSTWRDEDGVADQWTEIGPVSRWGFMHKGLDETGAKAYRYKATVKATDGTESSTADTAGGASTKADASDNSAVVAITVFAMNIVCLGEVTAASIKAGVITADKLSFTAFIVGTDDLDDVGDGTTYSRVLTTDITAGHVLLSATTGDLDDVSDGSSYGKVALTSITAGKIIVAGLDSGVTARMFSDGTAQTDIEAWRHISDLTMIDGGDIYAGSSITIGSSGHIKSGQTAYNTGTGWWIGDVSGTPKLSIGIAGSGNYITWDGASLTVRGDITAGTVTFAELLGGTNTASLVLGTNGSLRGGQTAYNTGTGFWLGYSSGYKFSIGNSSGGRLTWDGSTLSVSSLVVGASSSWGGNQLGTAYIPNLDAGKITTGTLVVARTQAKCTNAAADQTSVNTAANISGQGALATLSAVGASNCNSTIISGGKIITGLLTASNIQTGTLNASLITVTNLNASSVTAGTMSFARITAASVDIISSMLHASAVTYGKIAANAVHVAELYIDGDINFHPSASWYGITGMQGIYYSTSKSMSYPYIFLSAGALQLHGGTTAGFDVSIAAGGWISLASASGYDVNLFSGDDIVLRAADPGSDLTIYDWTTTTGNCNYAGGSVLVKVGATLRRVKLWRV